MQLERMMSRIACLWPRVYFQLYMTSAKSMFCELYLAIPQLRETPDTTTFSNNIAALLEHINLLLIHETPARMYMHYLCLELAEIIPTALVPPRDFEVFIPVCRPGCFEPPLFCNQDMIVKNTRSTSTAISQHVAPLYGPSKSAYI